MNQEVLLKNEGDSNGTRKNNNHHPPSKKKPKGSDNNVNSSLSSSKPKPHHATAKSLPSMNTSLLLQLSQASTDFKLQEELRHALLDSEQKENFSEAVQMSETLMSENNELKEKIEQLTYRMDDMLSENPILHKKMEILESSYHNLVKEYNFQLKEKEESIEQLKEELKHNQQQMETIKYSQQQNNLNDHSANNDNNNTGFEKKLFLQLQEEQHRNAELIRNNEEFLKKYEQMMTIQQKYNKLKKESHSAIGGLRMEIEELIQAGKMMENEVISLAAQKAHLEQENEDLSHILEQRDYETKMPNEKTIIIPNQNEHSIIPDDQSTESNSNKLSPNDYYSEEAENNGNNQDNTNNNENNNNNNVKNDEHQEFSDIDHILDLVFEEQILKKESGKNDNNNNSDNDKKEEDSVFVPDIIREYLHLTATTIKVKFPKVKDISSEDLIAKARFLPFYRYHDHMVKIMKNAERQKEEEKQSMLQANGNNTNNNNNSSNKQESPPTLIRKKFIFDMIERLFGKIKTEEDVSQNSKDTNNDNISIKRPFSANLQINDDENKNNDTLPTPVNIDNILGNMDSDDDEHYTINKTPTSREIGTKIQKGLLD